LANFIDPALIDPVDLVLPTSTNQNAEHHHGVFAFRVAFRILYGVFRQGHKMGGHKMGRGGFLQA